MRAGSALVLALALVGCATPVTMLRNDKTGQIARCGGGTTGFVAGGMIGKSIEQSSDARCVADYEAQGFRRSYAGDPQAIAAPRRELESTAAPGATPSVATGMKGESKYMFAAENVAKASGCIPTTVAMTAKGAGSESFMAGCPNGTMLAIRCEVDGCRILR